MPFYMIPKFLVTPISPTRDVDLKAVMVTGMRKRYNVNYKHSYVPENDQTIYECMYLYQ